MYTVLTLVHFFICSFLILVVLLQAGKGGGMGIAFGGGGSQTVFGSSGAGSFLTRLTAICAALFIINSLVLAYMSSQSDSKRLQQISEKKATEADARKNATDKLKADLEKAQKTGDKTAPAVNPIAIPAAPAAADKSDAVEKPAATPAASTETNAAKAPPAEMPAPVKPKAKRKMAEPKEEAPAKAEGEAPASPTPTPAPAPAAEEPGAAPPAE